jgi:3-hydroxyacyl-CoA dehydrogenase/3a,7a,12a-trihydroxy-5b-cholest-24-enoyl-CoA hydratase
MAPAGGSSAADKVVAEIKAAGGEAVASYDVDTEGANKIVQGRKPSEARHRRSTTPASRDVSFLKMSEEDWDRPCAHLSARCSCPSQPGRSL